MAGAQSALVVNFFSRANPEAGAWPYLFWPGEKAVRQQALDGRSLHLSAVAARGLAEGENRTASVATLFGKRTGGGQQPLLMVWSHQRPDDPWKLVQTLRSDSLGAVGTGGMLRGVSRALREGGSQARIVALEPSSSPALSEGRGGAHRVEGIGTGSVPPHMADRPYDEARSVDESDARAMARRLAREEGLLVGTSSGLNIAAAVQLAHELGPGKTVATVAVDTGLKYLAGDLFTE